MSKQLDQMAENCKKDIRKYFFSMRPIPEWISLPEAVVSAPSINSFKTRLDKYMGNANYAFFYFFIFFFFFFFFCFFCFFFLFFCCCFFFQRKGWVKNSDLKNQEYEIPISRPYKMLDVRRKTVEGGDLKPEHKKKKKKKKKKKTQVGSC